MMTRKNEVVIKNHRSHYPNPITLEYLLKNFTEQFLAKS